MGCCSSNQEPSSPKSPKESSSPKRHSRYSRVSRHSRHSGDKHHGVNFHEQYLLGRKVNFNGYAQTHIATKVEYGKPIADDMDSTRAVKIVDLRLGGGALSKILQQEVTHWKKIGSHTNCMRLYDVFQGHELAYLVMERTNGTLLNYLERLPFINETSLGEAFQQMLTGIKFLHETRTVHRDIKPDSFFVGGEFKRTIKLGDFGLSASMPEDGSKLRGECGTPSFNSPDMLCGSGYDEKTDIWSFGVTVHIFLFGRFPYTPMFSESKSSHKGTHAVDNAMKSAIINGEPISFRNTYELTPAVLAFAMLLLERKPERRPSAEDALKLKYMVTTSKKAWLQSQFGSTGRDPNSNAKLSDLKPAVERAKRMKAFDKKDLSQPSSIDDLLNRLQIEKLGVPVPTGDCEQGFSEQCSTKGFSEQSTTQSRKSGHGLKRDKSGNRSPPRKASPPSSRRNTRELTRHSRRSDISGETELSDDDDFVDDAPTECEV